LDEVLDFLRLSRANYIIMSEFSDGLLSQQEFDKTMGEKILFKGKTAI
jgi:hypothetical protein